MLHWQTWQYVAMGMFLKIKCTMRSNNYLVFLSFWCSHHPCFLLVYESYRASLLNLVIKDHKTSDILFSFGQQHLLPLVPVFSARLTLLYYPLKLDSVCLNACECSIKSHLFLWELMRLSSLSRCAPVYS